MTEHHYIIAGAGMAGAVCARCLAEGGKSVLVFEKRNHIGGNAYDCLDENGVLIHKYGPHIFHTESQKVYDFLSRFTEWRSYEHCVLAKAGSEEFPVPFNLNSVDTLFPAEKAQRIRQKLISFYGEGSRVTISELRCNEDEDIKEIADTVYHKVFLHYTMKQWGSSPDEIDPRVTARVPIFISRDNRYFHDKYQGMPKNGYTKMFENMLKHENITVLKNTDIKAHLSFTEDEVLVNGRAVAGNIIYTGALDTLFDYRFGALPYRTLDFEFEHHKKEFYQSHGTVNYTVDMPYTRITEFKHLTGQLLPHTTIMKEYSRAYDPASGDTPFYAVINEESQALYNKYFELACRYKNFIPLGRLAEYKYYNMDKIAHLAMELAESILK